ncbi:hypothetical protein CJ010_10645 [Azoarcus sp. DD4]|uniref:tetratricopeptide repeat protein n=1 Tax=Azoarcus sp. DD4 TaxID=2027405 RepID=UPI001125D7C6|nr:tetratricopeptide repeat protein [Azoarcus sp. DD4]QDF96954.1 hypothetical protein CJ010_10645 [Azoarcus sp. DD4]
MPRSLRHIVLAALITIALPAAAQDSTRADWVRNPGMGNYKAYAEFKMGRYAAAREVWEVLAGVGNAEALFNLGILAEDGLGEAQDMAKAEALYVAAANAGGRKAQYRLGLLYGPGGALGPDPDKARHYLGLAAAGGDQDAADQLAAMARPDAAPDDFTRAERLSAGGRHAEAAALFGRLAEDGHVRARTRLAWMFEAGRGVEPDLARAAALFARSAEAGDAEAQYAIAVMYRTGKGLPLDVDESRAWMARAAAQGYPAARAALAAEE